MFFLVQVLIFVSAQVVDIGLGISSIGTSFRSINSPYTAEAFIKMAQHPIPILKASTLWPSRSLKA